MRSSDWSSDVCSSDLAARERTASLARSLGSTEGTLAANNIASVRLAELERKAESARALYMAFLDRYKQTRAQRGLERSDSYVVGRARVPSVPSSPNRSEEHTAELQSLMRNSYADFCLKKKRQDKSSTHTNRD